MAIVHLAASLGLDGLVTKLLHGDPLDRAVASSVVNSAAKERERREMNQAIAIGNAVNGHKPDGSKA